jgi:xylulose-5-phosphate/fructose-6-phosphate phosphoketolase
LPQAGIIRNLGYTGNLAAVQLQREHLPQVKVRVINVIDLMTLQLEIKHLQGLNGRDFDMLFSKDKPVILAFHCKVWLIRCLTYRHTNHRKIHVPAYKEEGATTMPCDTVLLNDLDGYHLVVME